MVSVEGHLNYRETTKVCEKGALMSPVKVIAATALSIGMVTAAGIAGFAVVNSSSTSAATDTITLLANESATGQAPFYQPGDLPAVMTFQQDRSTTSGIASTQSTHAVSNRETPRTTSSAKQPEITDLQARSAVLAQVHGTVMSTTEVTHNGYEAFAVKLNLNDGSTATGYVDKKSGVVFDWAAVGAPATTGNSGGSSAVAPVSPQTTTHKDDDKNETHKEDTHKEESKSSGTTTNHDNDGDDD